MKTNLTLKLIALCLLPSSFCFRGFSQGTAFTYQGRLNDGVNPANGSYDLTFALFNAVSGPGQVAATLTNSATALSNGLFTVTLDFGAGVFTGTSLWLEIAVRTNGSANGFIILAPRQPLTASPYAITAANVTGGVNGSTITDGTITAAKIATNQVVTSLNTLRANITLQAGTNVAINVSTNNGTNAIVISAGAGGSGGGASGWFLTGNSNTKPGVNFLGTTDNQALELHANNTLAFRLEPAVLGPNVIGGSSLNSAFGSRGAATIGGGNNNTNNGGYSTIGGGENNAISGFAADSTIGGGGGNAIRVSSYGSTIAGGYSNSISGITSGGTNFIGGGQGNTIDSSENSTISGGGLNLIFLSSYAAVGGGEGNSGLGQWDTIGGGQSNQIFGLAATISGGSQNTISSARYSFIGGGLSNTISRFADNSTIAGGEANLISTNAASSSILGGQYNAVGAGGINATVAGGYNNVAGGQNSFAAGYQSIAEGYASFALGASAQASNNYSFVWSDGVPFPSTADYQFLIHALHGVGINKNNPTSALDVNGSINCVNLTAGGNIFGGNIYSQANIYATNGIVICESLTQLSDRNLKANFAAIDPQDVLERVVAMPISTWNFKQDSGTKHIGPMAQDFKAAFDVGTDDRHIAVVDAQGVALAAIQGLNQKLERTLRQKDAEILQLNQRNNSLEEKFEELRQTVRALTEKEKQHDRGLRVTN
jgi:hypothetical protein